MMLADRLQKILAVEEQERVFYMQRLKPALNRLEHAEDLHDERSNIEKLVLGTPFESAFHALEASGEQTQATLEHLYKLNHVCHDLMHNNHMARQSEVETLLNATPQSEFNPIVLYYLGCIYSQGDTEQDSQRAEHYLQQALSMPLPATQQDLVEKIRELYAQNHDRWQLRKTPSQPQKYGTIYADHHDVAKGLEKDHLVPPHSGYEYQMKDLDHARKELGLHSWAEQEIQRRK